MSRDDDDDGVTAEFSPQERRRIRKVIIANEHAIWLWTWVGILAKWIAGVGAALAVIKLGLGDLARYFK